MIEIKPMDEDYIHIDCLHFGPVDPASAPRRDDSWQSAPDLPQHPWSDETIAQVARIYKHISEGWSGDPGREFMREMILRYGTCAMLAWQEGQIIGHLRFYPLPIAQLLVRADSQRQKLVAETGAMRFAPDPGTLWVQCVMTTVPYTGPEAAAMGGRDFPSMEEAGARRGRGQSLVRGLIGWARKRGWRRIVKQAHPDLDYMYGIYGGGGKAFWEKAGFKDIGTHHEAWQKDDDWKATVESQAQAAGMNRQQAWTWHHMALDL